MNEEDRALDWKASEGWACAEREKSGGRKEGKLELLALMPAL